MGIDCAGHRDVHVAVRDTQPTLATDEQSSAPRQPNERDESSDLQASAPRDVMRQAASGYRARAQGHGLPQQRR